MILTIDLNPTMERKYIVDMIQPNKDIKAKSLVYNPGGNGIIASSLLDIFSEKCIMTGLLGGVNGEYFHRKLSEMGIVHEFVPIKEDTRMTINIKDDEGNCSIISEEGPRITRDEVVKFYELYSRLIEKTNIICALGKALPSGVPKDIYFDLVTLANKRGKKFILDVGVEELARAIDARPYMIILNQRELEDLIKVSLQFENEIIKVGRYILDKGVEFVVIDLQKRGSIVLGKERGYRVEIPYLDNNPLDINHSSMAVGFALGINRNYDIDMSLRLGQAFGIASTLESDVMRVEISDIKKLMGQIEIYPINYN